MAETGFRLSPTQRHLWSVVDQTAVRLWGQLSVLVTGDLEITHLTQSVRTATSRHEALRTSVRSASTGAVPFQVIADDAVSIATDYDLRGHHDRQAELDRIRSVERTGLNVRVGRATRVAVVRLGEQQWMLILTAHPLVADRRSLRLAMTEIARHYAGTEPGSAAPIQYADYAAWHNDLLTDAARTAERGYWDGHLEPALLSRAEELLTGADGTPSAWRTRRLLLGDALTAQLDRVAEGLGLGVDVLCAATWSVLSWRLCGERPLAAFATVAGRSYQELDEAVGPYSREAPVVCRFDRDMPFAAAAQQVAEVLAEAAGNVDDLDPNRLDPPTGHPTRVGFEYLDDAETITAGGVNFRPVEEEARHGAQAFTLRNGRGPSGLWAEVCHDTAVLGQEAADKLLSRFVATLRVIVAEPEAAVGTVHALLDGGERSRLLAAASGPTMPYPRRCVHELFTEQARRTPEAEAVRYQEQSFSYAELNAGANKLGNYLVTRGVQPGARVVLYLERSPLFLVGLLGVAKAGGAYVPVDIGHPWRRLEFVLSDSVVEGAAPLLLTQRSVAAEVPELAELPERGVGVVFLDDDWPTIAVHSEDDPAVATDPGDLAYVMYTSGTTGVPNGVAVPHRALVNYLTWCVDAYDMRSGTGSLVHSSVSFDLTITSLLGPLMVGQRAVLVPEGPGLAGFVAALRGQHDISLVKVTPTHLKVLSQLMSPEEVGERVRVLVIGGEELTAEPLLPFLAGGIRAFNEYGPTETVVGSCVHEISRRDALASRSISIGTPIANTAIHLLDANLEPVPDGVPAELYIGGDGVTSGYLNRPELTAQRFVHDPFTGSPGARLYRTGDRARRLPGGDLQYLGRFDDQVKVRGFRVELSEIEEVLRQHPDVEQVAVVAGYDADSPAPLVDDAQLVACVVTGRTDPGATPSVEELIGFCHQRLPAYEIPHAIVMLDELPLTPNGKLDRAALSRIPRGRPVAGEYVPPRNPTEEILAGSIASVLGLDRVGIDDNYFVLGGDSIRSVMVSSRAQARGVEVAAADLHRHPTVRGCAEAILARRERREEPHTEPFSLISAEDRALMPPDVADAFPLNLLQEGMIFHRDFAAKSAVYHAIASVRVRAPFDLDVLRLVIKQLVERHPMLRTSFDMTSFSRPLQLIHRTFRDPLSYEDLRGMPEQEQQRRITGWVESEKLRGFELDEFPLIRFMAQRLDDETFQFTYGFHHEIVDGWSEALMVTELFTHYLSIMFDEPVAIKPPSSTMRDAVALEIEALNHQENYDFWSRYLADATLMRLPRLLSASQADKGAREIVRIAVPVSEELSDALKGVARHCAVPLKSVLLAAHMRVMCQYHGQTDTLTYTVTNGRPESADGSTAIGLFVNSLALRLDLTGGSWRDLILQTLDAERASMPYRRLPMAELKRHQGNEPLAETLFFFTDYHVFHVLERWRAKGVEHLASEVYGESTFPFCAIFRVNRDTSQLEIRIEYDSLQFPAELMESISECYIRVLEAVAADPDAPYHLGELLAEGERARTLVEWNDTAATFAGDGCVHELIEAQARRTPDAVALECDDTTVTYRELMRRAGRIAARLRGRGVGVETRVGILAERSIEMIACILGVLRAGGAYVPLDPAHPEERLTAVLADADPVLVLAQRKHADRLAAKPYDVVAVDAELSFPGEATGPAPRGGTPAGAAYVMYTSGSTGTPKGVLVSHSSLVNSTLARRHAYPEPPDRFLLLSPFAFDSSVVGIFWTLSEGGTLVLPREGMQLEPGELSRYIARARVTHMLGVPSLLLPLVEQAGRGALESLRVLIAAGEACPKELLEEAAEAAPQARLHNEYGPTENTVWSTVWTGDPISYRPHLPIGRPVANTAAYLINPHLNPVPVGVAAEMYLGGAGLARGYLGRPAATAASFLPDPFASEPGARMYRTGDIARHTLQGVAEFLGRADNQVKIRGFRVELGEIEGLLNAHPAVQRAVVLVRDDPSGDKMLAAYVVPRHADLPPEAADLQAYIRDRLPKYMVPATFVVLDALPLTATGKIDRASLPVPGRPQRVRAAAVRPRNELEQMLAALWCQVLGLDEVGVEDDFFELGGESLRAMQVINRTNKVFDLDLSVRSLFEATTIAAFTEKVEAARLLADASGGAFASDLTAAAADGRQEG